MGVTENAVKYHIANLGSKLGVGGLAALRQWPGYPIDSPMSDRSTTMETSVLGPLGQVSLYARDVARTERFYRDTLGLPHIFTFGDLAFFDCGGVRLYVHCVADEKWRASSVLYFRVADIDASVKELAALGIAFVGQPHRIHRDEATGDEEWMAFFEDPDGNMLALMSRVAAAA
jgi:catechol 2,3-dioxygenase-like lactoylglutathione lyase family enzyme